MSTHDPIAIALAEDIGPGDVTAQYFIPADLRGAARIVAREQAIVAGAEIARETFARVDTTLDARVIAKDSTLVNPGDTVLEITGPVRSIVTAERVALNFLQRLSGVATLTGKYVEAVKGTHAVILDTRKTTPGMRTLEKAAVVSGGGRNHRIGLYDMVLVKDNHLLARADLAWLQSAIDAARASKPGMPATQIELEADTLEQVRGFLTLRGVDFILLDNMGNAQLREAVAMRATAKNSLVKFEASGGVSLETVRAIAETGVDFISVGALTHSARAIDFSLELAGR